jgi:hypothetical protein
VVLTVVCRLFTSSLSLLIIVHFPAPEGPHTINTVLVGISCVSAESEFDSDSIEKVIRDYSSSVVPGGFGVIS